jgi:4-hydroxy-3-polyprenylbenzoate decarboxylase
MSRASRPAGSLKHEAIAYIISARLVQSEPDRNMKTRKLIVGISGATGAIFGVRLLQLLRKQEVETHLIVSRWGARTLAHETPYTLEQVQAIATTHYSSQDQGAAISSGSFVTDGMVLCPCSVRSLAAIAHGHGDNLLHRAADVVLKERRKLVLVVRETPLSDIHLENMLKLSRMGVVIFPPVPAFYTQPQSIDDIVEQTAIRILDQFDLHIASEKRWQGDLSAPAVAPKKPLTVKIRR